MLAVYATNAICRLADRQPLLVKELQSVTGTMVDSIRQSDLTPQAQNSLVQQLTETIGDPLPKIKMIEGIKLEAPSSSTGASQEFTYLKRKLPRTATELKTRLLNLQASLDPAVKPAYEAAYNAGVAMFNQPPAESQKKELSVAALESALEMTFSPVTELSQYKVLHDSRVKLANEIKAVVGNAVVDGDSKPLPTGINDYYRRMSGIMDQHRRPNGSEMEGPVSETEKFLMGSFKGGMLAGIRTMRLSHYVISDAAKTQRSH